MAQLPVTAVLDDELREWDYGDYEGLRTAMDWYERAEAVRPPGNVDAVLRWNSCVRTIEREHLEPAPVELEQPLE